MQNHQSFAAFVAICLLLTITPGADTALILRSAMAGGRKYFVATTCGICTGLLIHASISSLGMSAILLESAKLYSAIRLIGAGYLIYLGVRGLYEVWFGPTLVEASEKQVARSLRAEFRRGLLTNILNPKVAVFYLTFLPQFVDINGNAFLQSIGLATVHVSMSFVWLCLVGYFVAFFRVQLANTVVRRAVESVTGFALLAFGARLAITR